ncbi:hypothetical protein C8035_v005075 [Colletotrichum spinosum]|uniref:EthD domain-containing protein n=1 Tax=Colletotrichum spinosum TaxID=1347390 RepID=A0A4R8QD26_9PEZI|nr:hypothetical protein C8035_v005075 [Colletotrichum spinosum]
MVRISLPFSLAAATLLSSSVALCSHTGLVQMLSYVKRHPDFSRDQFWDYWYNEHAPKVAPLATYFNITRYQQVRVGGQILPTEAGSTTPASLEPVDFDGIAMFLYRSADDLVAFLAHPYYTEIVQPDERVFIDQGAFGAGQVAVFIGEHMEAVNGNQNVWGGNSTVKAKYQEIFDSYQV